jgi:putative ABC transport system substrate-binding protein
MRRRDLIALLGSAAAAWPLAARAQQPAQIRRIAVFINLAPADPQSLARVTAFAQGLQRLGWTAGRNVQIEYRWGAAANAEHLRSYAAELIALAPDVIVVGGTSFLAALQEASRTIPIVFVDAPDPVGGGFVESLAHPGGNATGFTTFEYGFSGKWLELLKQIVPRLRRVAVVRDPTNPTTVGQFGAIQSAAPSFGVELRPLDVRDPAEIERGVTAFAREPDSGLIVPSSVFAIVHRDLIITLAAKHRLPTIYAYPDFVTSGGLISYGPDQVGEYGLASGYVDRILRGEKPADLPVQAPTKYELLINLKTAKALGLSVPPNLLALADEVIE